jgi:hypothetical protein
MLASSLVLGMAASDSSTLPFLVACTKVALCRDRREFKTLVNVMPALLWRSPESFPVAKWRGVVVVEREVFGNTILGRTKRLVEAMERAPVPAATSFSKQSARIIFLFI